MLRDDLLRLVLAAVPIPELADDASEDPITELWISLHTGDPGDDGDQETNEATYGAYERMSLARDGSSWVFTSEGARLADRLFFPRATSGSETLTHFAIGTSETGAGLLLHSDPLGTPVVVVAGVRPVLAKSPAQLAAGLAESVTVALGVGATLAYAAGSAAAEATAAGVGDSEEAEVLRALRVFAFASNDTHALPKSGAFWHQDGTADAFEAICYGAGGGGETDTGAGGGGACSTKKQALSGLASSTLTVIVPGNTTAPNDGGDCEVSDGTTVFVRAKGGLGGANGGTGGAAASGIGDSKYSGGDGTQTTGTSTAGSGASRFESASGATPGNPEGGATPAAQIAPYGGGGRSTATTRQAGWRAHGVIEYDVPATSGFPRLRGYTLWRRPSGTGTSHVPDVTVAGTESTDRLYVIARGTNTSELDTSSDGWTRLGHQDGVAIFYRTGAGALTVTQATTGRLVTTTLRVANGGVPQWTANADATSTNPDPPEHAFSGGSQKSLVVAIAGWRGSTNANITACPSSYGNWLIVPPLASAHSWMSIATREVDGDSEDPGAFTNGSGAHVAATLMIPYSA